MKSSLIKGLSKQIQIKESDYVRLLKNYKYLTFEKNTFILLAIIITNCKSGNIEQLNSNGNYEAAINKSISKLITYKNSKGKQEYVYLLQEEK